MSKLQLSPLELNIFQTLLAAAASFGAYLVTNSATFPVQYQALASIGGALLGYFAADLLAVLKGQQAPPPVATAASTASRSYALTLSYDNQYITLPPQYEFTSTETANFS